MASQGLTEPVTFVASKHRAERPRDAYKTRSWNAKGATLNYAIVRIYGTAQQATDVITRLKSSGFADEPINLVAPPGTPGAPSSDGLVDAIAKGYVLKADAEQYAEQVRAGKWLVSVLAPLGTGPNAVKILNKFKPESFTVDHAADHVAGWDDSAPLSSALWLPLLSKESTPFSRMWGIPLLLKRRSR